MVQEDEYEKRRRVMEKKQFEEEIVKREMSDGLYLDTKNQQSEEGKMKHERRKGSQGT